jgi:hypothetical protein
MTNITVKKNDTKPYTLRIPVLISENTLDEYKYLSGNQSNLLCTVETPLLDLDLPRDVFSQALKFHFKEGICGGYSAKSAGLMVDYDHPIMADVEGPEFQSYIAEKIRKTIIREAYGRINYQTVVEEFFANPDRRPELSHLEGRQTYPEFKACCNELAQRLQRAITEAGVLVDNDYQILNINVPSKSLSNLNLFMEERFKEVKEAIEVHHKREVQAIKERGERERALKMAEIAAATEAWMNKKGSERLRKGAAAGYSMTRLYREERWADLFKTADIDTDKVKVFYDYENEGPTELKASPSIEALDLMESLGKVLKALDIEGCCPDVTIVYGAPNLMHEDNSEMIRIERFPDPNAPDVYVQL